MLDQGEESVYHNDEVLEVCQMGDNREVWPVSDGTSLGKCHSFNLPVVFASFQVDSRTDRDLCIRLGCLRLSFLYSSCPCSYPPFHGLPYSY